MALIKCPDCGKEISDSAPTCPGCGRSISSTAQQPTVIIQQPAQEKPKKKMGCLSILGVIFIILIVAAMMTNRDGKTTPSGSSPSASKPAPAALSVSPSQLVKDYDSNEVAADQKYKGKRLSVEGAIEDLGKDILDNMYIILNSGHAIRSVQCFFPDRAANQIAQLKKGQRVKIEGVCEGLMMNVMIEECELK